MTDEKLTATVADHGCAVASLRMRWLQVAAGDLDAMTKAQDVTGVEFDTAGSRVWESDTFIYLPVVVNIRNGETVRRERIVFALGGDVLVTLQPATPFAAFGKALARLRRLPHLAESAQGVMYALLYALNEAQEHVIDHASDVLEDMSEEIQLATDGYDEHGTDIGVSDMQDTIKRMNLAEEIVSRCQESQLMLARAARHLRTETSAADDALAAQIDVLVADINSVKDHASYEHDKVRYLQQSIMTSLDVKQNQIVKVFTIITAVFLPPTLIATFYGMNFTNMPELNWEHGFLITTLLTFVAALIPLWYIRRRGWLR
ncbi:Magnesium transport protein CorA (plasmid) [Streptomyces sp. YIM 121038]|uniref:CorA family divalent cation transporter n=1 Tax=Streptomyces sp. YIM 121038 TaxID=2136401 RepID=UPI0011108051|nr:CorA family divalent cation transporter [Streptomyces sp. YIM 121038]QCX82654.1 Magnesium transport protein CorA [Streptomyces sp. YIM 121038]